MMNKRNTRGSVAGGIVLAGIAACMLNAANARADLVTVDPGAGWIGYMTVFNLPSDPTDPGAYQFEGGWGTADLAAVFSGSILTLSPNTIGDPNEYWYQNTSGTAPDPANPGGPGQLGNKTMNAAMYVEETGPLSGQTVTFAGTVIANTFTPAHTTSLFIRDFAPDYSSSVDLYVPLPTSGDFSIELATIADPTRHVQYGFLTVGENVWITDTGPFGTAQITAIPEPSTLLLAGLGAVIMLVRSSRRRQA